MPVCQHEHSISKTTELISFSLNILDMNEIKKLCGWTTRVEKYVFGG